MKKSLKVENNIFLHLTNRSLCLDQNESSGILPIPDLDDKVLDFSVDETGTIRIFTVDGRALRFTLKSMKKPQVVNFSGEFLSASICNELVLVCRSDFSGILYEFDTGNIQREFSFEGYNLRPRLCLLTPLLAAFADSTKLVTFRNGIEQAIPTKFRKYHLKSIITVNRDDEFGLITTENTRIYRKEFTETFRKWATNTVSLLQCQGSLHIYAHLGEDGVLRIGDSSADYTLQEIGVTGICWDMGVLWARNQSGLWHQVVLSYNDQVFDLRNDRLEGLSVPLDISSINALGLLEALKERPALGREILPNLPAVAQNLTEGIIVQEVKHSLDAYIKKAEPLNQLVGQIDLALFLANQQ